MSASTEPRNGIQYGWSLGEAGWNTGMDANLLKIGHVGMHLSIIDRDLTAPPEPDSTGPNDGDTYIVGPSATGDWSGHDDDIAVYSIDTWVFYTPRVGYLAYIEDEAVLSVYKAAGWSAGVSI